ncbi:serine aminopeptidase domain-containing protein [Rhodoferax sp.]|uniref:alpha/beta hydrolase family protein n=1 Tax=Rhodoferax sp. TaxID=50421 RepID=UPI002ACDB4F7|nr:alpha/beta hydrolase [Rhodoferax sp.]MDZ7921220.1 alpha/beta hydrolase [Rhodoferax sp.]
MTSTNTQDMASRWLPGTNMTPAMQHLTQAFESPPGADQSELDLCLTTQDGSQLWATVFEPRTSARAVALVAPATAVPRHYYRAFARWLSTRGYAVLTLDYRGIGESRLAAQPARSISMRDWMQQDLQAALAAVQHRARANSGAPLATLWVGHSLGGHALAQCQGLEDIDAAIGVAAQLPFWRLWPRWHQRMGALLFFGLWLPLCVRLFGRLPGWALGGGEELPAAAALDWSRWGMTPGYFTSDPTVEITAHRWTGTAHLWAISDDKVFGPRRVVEALQQAFANAPGVAELRHVTPADLGVPRIGHFGPFRRTIGERLWPRLLDDIETAVPQLKG